MLMPCEITVSSAVPAASITKKRTNTTSSTMLIAQATPTNHMGRRESPQPRSTALMAL